MIVLDSDALILRLRGDAATIALLRKHEDEELATTSANVAEVLRGVATNPRRLAVAKRVLRGLVEVPFGPRAARRFATFMAQLDRVGTPIGTVDGMVAAAALESGASIMTRNVREFERVPGLVPIPLTT